MKFPLKTAAAVLAIATAMPALAATTINGSTSGFTVTGPTGNTCGGAGGINDCYATPTGTVQQGNPGTEGSSPMVIRIEGNENGSRGSSDISTLFPTIDGNEFTLTYDAGANTLSFVYTPGVGDPTLHYVGIFQASDYFLYYDANAITSGTIDLTSLYPGHPGWSHIDFYDTGGAVPEPATWAMMLLGFGGIGLAMRSRRRKGRLLQIA